MPYCAWPRATCHQPATRQERGGAAFCPEHYLAWAAVMHDLMSGQTHVQQPQQVSPAPWWPTPPREDDMDHDVSGHPIIPTCGH